MRRYWTDHLVLFVAMLCFVLAGWVAGSGFPRQLFEKSPESSPPPAIYNFTPVQYQLKQIDDRLSRIEAVVVGKPSKLENSQ